MADPTKEKLTTRVTKFLNDVATLDVVTLTGTVSLEGVQKGADKEQDPLNWDKLFENITAGMKANGANKLEVVAYTHASWDCDSVNYIKSGLTDAEVKLVENHNKAVEAAHRSRYEALQFIGKALGSL
jgi:hypothetical protein